MFLEIFWNIILENQWLNQHVHFDLLTGIWDNAVLDISVQTNVLIINRFVLQELGFLLGVVSDCEELVGFAHRG